uniref:Uncharacterized protein n=1 Tax=Romanomermis culicivorax TaxID=13658 RepID=A0A915IZ99_ROMCU
MPEQIKRQIKQGKNGYKTLNMLNCLFLNDRCSGFTKLSTAENGIKKDHPFESYGIFKIPNSACVRTVVDFGLSWATRPTDMVDLQEWSTYWEDTTQPLSAATESILHNTFTCRECLAISDCSCGNF